MKYMNAGQRQQSDKREGRTRQSENMGNTDDGFAVKYMVGRRRKDYPDSDSELVIRARRTQLDGPHRLPRARIGFDLS